MSDHTTLTDRIMALETQESRDGAGAFVSRDQVLAVVTNAIPVEIDQSMYSSPSSLSVEEVEVLTVISTAYNLLADKAAEIASREIRKRAEKAGVQMASDAEVFEENKASSDPERVTSYRDLAVHDGDSIMKLGDIFDRLIRESSREAMEGLLMSLVSKAAGSEVISALEEMLRREGS